MNEHETEANALKKLLSSVCLNAVIYDYSCDWSGKYATWEFV